MICVGWTDAYTSPYKEEPFTEEHKKALIECVHRRHYNFTYQNMCFLPYNAPFFDTGKLAIPSKAQLDEVFNVAYADIPFGKRLAPFDAIKRKPINGVIYEKADYEPKEGESNG